MSRPITSAFTTEKNKQAGAHPLWLLQIDFASPTGTKYFAGETLSAAPVNAEGRVISWGNLSLQAEPERVGGHSEVVIKLADPDLFLKGLFDTEPGVQNVTANIWLFFVGTTWPDDRLNIFRGIVSGPAKWSTRDPAWEIRLKGIEHRLDVTIGQKITREIFPEVKCTDCEGEQIPIVFGDPCLRVPACVIDHPGAGVLGRSLYVLDSFLYLARSAVDDGFNVGTPITLIVGFGGRNEVITGSFDNPGDRTRFRINTRGAIQAAGTIPGFFGAGGVQYILIPKSVFADWTPSRAGYPLYLRTQSGAWVTTMITYWSAAGGNIIVAEKGQIDVVTGSAFKIGSAPGTVPIWRPGTPVYEDAPWVYLVNYLPSKSVTRVEAQGNVNMPGGDQRRVWLSYNPVWYTVSLNNTAYNAALGRGGGDPGVTTITIASPPAANGFDDNHIYVTLSGCTSNDLPSGTVLTNPARIIERLLRSPWLGGVPTGNIDGDSIDAAAASIATSMAFALREPKQLMDLVGDLAYQGMCVLFWDQGKAYLKAVDTEPAGTALFTATETNVLEERGLEIEDLDMHDVPTQLTSTARLSIPAEEIKLVRSSLEAIAYWGQRGKRRRLSDDETNKDESLDLWAYQAPTSIALVTEHWLQYGLHLNRRVTFTTTLTAVHLQPSDIIEVDFADGDGNAVIDGVTSRVQRITHAPHNAVEQRMEALTITVEQQIHTITIETVAPSDLTCDPPGPIPESVQYDGTNGIGDQVIPFTPRHEPNAETSGTTYLSSSIDTSSATPTTGSSSSVPSSSSSSDESSDISSDTSSDESESESGSSSSSSSTLTSSDTSSETTVTSPNTSSAETTSGGTSVESSSSSESTSGTTSGTSSDESSDESTDTSSEETTSGTSSSAGSIAGSLCSPAYSAADSGTNPSVSNPAGWSNVSDATGESDGSGAIATIDTGELLQDGTTHLILSNFAGLDIPGAVMNDGFTFEVTVRARASLDAAATLAAIQVRIGGVWYNSGTFGGAGVTTSWDNYIAGSTDPNSPDWWNGASPRVPDNLRDPDFAVRIYFTPLTDVTIEVDSVTVCWAGVAQLTFYPSAAAQDDGYIINPNGPGIAWESLSDATGPPDGSYATVSLDIAEAVPESSQRLKLTEWRDAAGNPMAIPTSVRILNTFGVLASDAYIRCGGDPGTHAATNYENGTLQGFRLGLPTEADPYRSYAVTFAGGLDWQILGDGNWLGADETSAGSDNLMFTRSQMAGSGFGLYCNLVRVTDPETGAIECRLDAARLRLLIEYRPAP